MIQRVLSHYQLTQLTCLGLLLFMAVFVGAVFWVFKKSNNEIYSGLEQLPLIDLKPSNKGDRLYD